MTSSPSAGHRSRDVEVTVVTDLAGLEAIRADWTALHAAVPTSDPFQSPEYVLTWLDHFAVPRRPIHAVVVRRSGVLVGICTLALTRLGVGPVSFDLLVNAGTEHGDYGEPLVDPDDAEARAALCEHLVRLARSGRVAVNLRRLRDDGFLDAALAARDDLRIVPMAEPAESCVVRFALMADPARELHAMARRRDVLRNLRRLNEAHTIESRALAPAEGLPLIERMLGERWDEGDGPKAFSSPRQRAFTYDVVTQLAAAGSAAIHGTFGDGEPICVALEMQAGDRRVGDTLAVNQRFAKYGPGHLQIHDTLQRALSDGMTEVDFRAGDHGYKFKWANHRRVSQSVALVRDDRIGDLQLLLRRAAMSYRVRQLRRARRTVTP